MGAYTMRISSRLLLLVLLLGATVSAQSPTYHLGRTPTPDEVRAWDIAISPDGHELPPGHGTAKEGKDLFIEKGCVQCHGRNGEGGKAPTLIVMKGMSTSASTLTRGKDVGLQRPGLAADYSPVTTVRWDYNSRVLPLRRGRS